MLWKNKYLPRLPSRRQSGKASRIHPDVEPKFKRLMKNTFIALLGSLLLAGSLPAQETFYLGDTLAFHKIAEGEVGIAAASKQPKGNLVIPDSVTFDGITYAVTSVGYTTEGTHKGFGYSSGIKSVVIPNTVRNINYQAFVRCSSLKQVEMSDSVETIGYAAFGLCTSLESVKFGPKLKSIEREGFYNCTSFDSLDIPASLTHVGEQAFSGCRFVNIDVDESNPRYASENGVWYTKQKDTLLRYPPRKPDSRFALPSTVNAIGQSAFTDAANLLEVDMSQAPLESIGIAAFLTCGINSLTLPNTVKHIDYNAFNGCRSLSSANIGTSVEYLGSGAFYYCDRLKEILLPETLRYIGGSAFEKTGLTEIRIPASVAFIGENAFESCKELENIDVDQQNAAYASPSGILMNKAQDTLLFCPRGKAGDIVLPEGLKHIGHNAFGYCDSIVSVQMPNTVESLANLAFQRCKGLKNVTLSENLLRIDTSCFSNCHAIAEMELPGKLRFIAPSAFEYLKALPEVILPNSLESLGSSAFQGCQSVLSFHFPDSLEEIPLNLLSGCSSLQDVRLPKNLKKVGSTAFIQCSSLTEMVFPEGLVEIGDRAFTNAKALKKVDFPSTLQRLGQTVFYSCKQLSEVICRNPSAPAAGSNAFGSCPDTAILTVPCGSAEAYRTTANWIAIDSIEEQLFHSITVSVNDTAMGLVEVSGSPSCQNPAAILNAIPKSGYYFVQWSNGSKENPLHADLSESSLEIQAEFEAVPVSTFVVTFTIPEGGSISATCNGETVQSGMALDSGSVLNLKAEAAHGHAFEKWWDGNTESERTYRLEADVTIDAAFNPESYALTIAQSEGGRISASCNGVPVSSGDLVAYGSTLELSAEPEQGYRFVQWWDGNTGSERNLSQRPAGSFGFLRVDFRKRRIRCLCLPHPPQSFRRAFPCGTASPLPDRGIRPLGKPPLGRRIPCSHELPLSDI